MPALFTRMCTPPSSAIVRRTAWSTASGWVISVTIGRAQSAPPIDRMSVALCSNQEALRSRSATRAPARTRPTAIACPRPIGLPAPVIIATLPCRGPSAIIFPPDPLDGFPSRAGPGHARCLPSDVTHEARRLDADHLPCTRGLQQEIFSCVHADQPYLLAPEPALDAVRRPGSCWLCRT